MNFYYAENPNTGDTEPGLYCAECAESTTSSFVVAMYPDQSKCCIICDCPVAQVASRAERDAERGDRLRDERRDEPEHWEWMHRDIPTTSNE